MEQRLKKSQGHHGSWYHSKTTLKIVPGQRPAKVEPFPDNFYAERAELSFFARFHDT